MRRFIASSLAGLMLTLGVPLVGAANGATANVVGQVVDASGRGANTTRVELVLNGATVGTTSTTYGGSFMFTGIVPGTYQVRAMVNGRPTGLQLTVSAGQSASVVVVLPSMVTAVAQAQLASLLANLSTTLAGVAGATVAAEALEAASEDEDLQDIVDALEADEVVTLLVSALSATQGTLNPQQSQDLGRTLGQIIASLPPEASAQLQQEIDEALDEIAAQPNPGPGSILSQIVIPSNPISNNNPTTGSPNQ